MGAHPIQAYRKWERTQNLVILPFTLIAAGLAAVILGKGAARSFGALAGDGPIRTTGAIMLIGGITIVIALRQNKAAMEALGLSIGALGAAFYGLGTLIGFGTGGIVSGIGWVGIAAVLVSRIVFAFSYAKARHQIEDG